MLHFIQRPGLVVTRRCRNV